MNGAEISIKTLFCFSRVGFFQSVMTPEFSWVQSIWAIWREGALILRACVGFIVTEPREGF